MESAQVRGSSSAANARMMRNSPPRFVPPAVVYDYANDAYADDNFVVPDEEEVHSSDDYESDTSGAYSEEDY